MQLPSRRLAAGSALGALVLALTVGAGAVPAAAASGEIHFRIAGGGAPALPDSPSNGAVLRLKNGAEIAAALVRKTSGGPPRLEIYRHASGAAHWTHHLGGSSSGFKQAVARVPLKNVRITLALSPNLKYVDVVVDACRYGLVASTLATVGPTIKGKLKRAFAAPQPYGCSAAQQSEHSGKGFVGSTPIPYGEFGLLAAVFNADGASPVVGFSQPGNGFGSLTSLPVVTDAADKPVRVVATGVARDPKTGELTVVGVGADNNAYAWTTFLTQSDSGELNGDWSSPQLIYAGVAGAETGVASVAAYGGTVFVGIDQDTSNAPVRALDNTMGYVERSGDGTWSAFAKVPHSGAHDLWGPAEFNPSSGSLHATWTRATAYSKAGTPLSFALRHAVLAHGTWSTAKVLVNHRVIDAVTSLALTAQGHPVVGYVSGS